MKTQILKSALQNISIAILIVWMSNVYTNLHAQDMKAVQTTTIDNDVFSNSEKINPNLSSWSGVNGIVTNFYVSCNPNQTHNIYWKTINESDSIFFTVYKNYDSINWQYAVNFPIVQGLGASHLYSVTDMVLNQPDTYYLLRVSQIVNKQLVDTYYGPIMGEDCNENLHLVLKVYPNPASDVANVTIEGLDADRECLVSLYNENGLQVQGMQVVRDGNTFSLNLNDLKSGRYFVHAVVPGTGETFSKVIVKM
ncbi:MAG: T9SS type A sorting domain-containing protein [Bacteroidota bacterium]